MTKWVATVATAIVLVTASAAYAAVAVKNVQTRNFGVIRCWVGDNANNTITDSNNTNCIVGLGGNDTLRGQGGNDKIDGEGDLHRDNLHGGGGTDTFYVGPEVGIGDSRIDRIWDMTAGETICTRAAFTGSPRRVVANTGAGDRYIVVRVFGGDVAIAWVRALGTKSINVRPACFLRNQ